MADAEGGLSGDPADRDGLETPAPRVRGLVSGDVATMAGMRLPVSPLKRYEHYFTPGAPMERLPYVKDLARMAFRSEGKGFSGGLVDGDGARG